MGFYRVTKAVSSKKRTVWTINDQTILEVIKLPFIKTLARIESSWEWAGSHSEIQQVTVLPILNDETRA